MRKFLVTGGLALAVALMSVPQAKAAALLTIDVSGTSATCNNSTAAGVAACAAAGFTTVLNSDNIVYTGGPLNGVSIGNVSLDGNAPGTPLIANVLDSKFNLNNTSGASRTVTVDFAVNNFTAPTGQGFLDASQTGNWTTSAATDNQNFTAWQRNDNLLAVPGGSITAISPVCVSGGGTSQSCSTETLDVPGIVTAPFALTGRQMILMANGTQGSFTGTATLTPTAAPEPAAMLLLGGGLVAVSRRLRRARRA